MWASSSGNLLDTVSHAADASIQRSYQAIVAAMVAERARLLAAVRSTINAVLACALDGNSGALRCDMPVVRDLCVAVEAALEHQLLPPFFSLTGVGCLWHALTHLQHSCRRGAGRARASGDAIHLPAEAVALARGLCEKQLSLAAPHAPAALRDAYAARLWLGLALQRRVLAQWIEMLADALPSAYAEGALLTTADDCGVLIDLLTPLAHVGFALPERAPHRRRLASFLALGGAAGDVCGVPMPPHEASWSPLAPASAHADKSAVGDDERDREESAEGSECGGSDAGGDATADDVASMAEDGAAVCMPPTATESPPAPTDVSEAVSVDAASSRRNGARTVRSHTGHRRTPVAAPILDPAEPSAATSTAARLGAAAAAAIVAAAATAPLLGGGGGGVSSGVVTGEAASILGRVGRLGDVGIAGGVAEEYAGAKSSQVPEASEGVLAHQDAGTRATPEVVAAPLLRLDECTSSKLATNDHALSDHADTSPLQALCAVAARGTKAANPIADPATATSDYAADGCNGTTCACEGAASSSGSTGLASGMLPAAVVRPSQDAEVAGMAAVAPQTASCDAQLEPIVTPPLSTSMEAQAVSPLKATTAQLPGAACAGSEQEAQASTAVEDSAAGPTAPAPPSPPAAVATAGEGGSQISGALERVIPHPSANGQQQSAATLSKAVGVCPNAAAPSATGCSGGGGVDRACCEPLTKLRTELTGCLRAGELTPSASVRLRHEACTVGVSWHSLLLEADRAVDVDDASMDVILGPCASADRLVLYAADGDGTPTFGARGASAGAGPAEAALLRRVCPRRGAHMMIGVSGVLSKHEGDMRPTTQPMQLSACWAAAAAFLQVSEWWSLSWGGVPLSALASELHAVEPSLMPSADGAPPRSSIETAATLAQAALALRGPWGACYDAAKGAGAALAAHLRAQGGGRRPVSLLGVSLGARVVWQCLEILAALPDGEGVGVVQDVLLLAAPVTANPVRWERIAPVVAGRLINAYVREDTQLAVLYRLDHLASRGCCGLAPVPSSVVENIDATPHVAADSRSYHFALPALLEAAQLFPRC